MLRSLQHLPCEWKLGEMGLLSPEKRQLLGKLIKAFNTYKTTEKIEPGSDLKCRVGGQDTAVINYTGRKKILHGSNEEQEQVA